KTLSVILCMVSMITTATGVLDPESTYKQIINRKENIIYTLKKGRHDYGRTNNQHQHKNI
ncbi:hypothetical protein ACSLOS_31975, partial [Klebsiella pneumoniae]